MCWWGATFSPPRGAGLTVPGVPQGGPVFMPGLPQGGGFVVPGVPQGGLTIPGAGRARGALKISLALPGTPVEMKFIERGAPMPAKVLPLNLTTGSTRYTRFVLSSLK